jgi:hypothetical protein
MSNLFQNYYAVALSNPGAYHFGDVWIECYWADNAEHAKEQAQDANTSAEILAVKIVAN